MTGLVAVLLVLLAAVDGTLAGFRSSVGRTGLIDHRGADRTAAGRGLRRAAVLLAPVIIAVSLDTVRHPDRLPIYARAGAGLLAVYLPYAVVVLVALAVYLGLHWRLKYLASAVILGPFTLVRPAVVVLGGVLGIVWSADLRAALAVVWAVAAVLAVEPLTDRTYARSGLSPAAGCPPPSRARRA